VRDGGYLIPNDLAGIQACFSPGVDDRASFESALATDHKIPSHLADFSVDGPPKGFLPDSFSKMFVGPKATPNTMTLETWVSEADVPKGDLLLQMDIEGAEYETLLATPDALLRRFRIIILEVHSFGRIAEPGFYRVYESYD